MENVTPDSTLRAVEQGILALVLPLGDDLVVGHLVLRRRHIYGVFANLRDLSRSDRDHTPRPNWDVSRLPIQ